mgnify:CR=1 FL=1
MADSETGSQWKFDADKLRSMYKSVHGYRRAAGQAIQRQMQAGFLLQADAEVLRRETIENALF